MMLVFEMCGNSIPVLAREEEMRNSTTNTKI